MQKSGAGRGDPPWPLVLAVSLSLSLVSPLVFGLFDGSADLAQFRDRAIGETTLQGVDASGYARGYVRMTAALAASFVALFFVLGRLDRFLREKVDPSSIRMETAAIERLSEISIVLLLMRVIVRDDFLASLALLVYGLIGLLFVSIAVRIVLSRRDGGTGGLSLLLADGRFLVASLLFPFPPLFAFQVIFDQPIGFGDVSALAGISIYLLVILLFLTCYGVTARRWAGEMDRLRRWNARVVLAAAPLLLIPISIPLSNEVQVLFPETSPRAISVTMMAFLALASGVLFAWHGRRNFTVRPATLLELFYFPLFLVTNAVFAVHRHVLHLGSLDYFHTGELTVPTQQLFHFSRIPLIDLRPAHTLSDLFYPSLYTLVHGYRGMDMLIWTSWMPAVVAVLVIYFFLARLVSPAFALTAAALAPVLGTVTSYYALALLPPIFLAAAFRRPTLGRFVLMWASVAGLTLWRFDFGLVGWVASGLIVAVWLARNPARWKAVAPALAVVAAACLLAVVLVSFLSHRPTFETLFFLVKSYTFRLATRTRAEIIHQYSTVAVLQYYLLPAVSLVVVSTFAVRRLIRRRYFSPGQHMLVFVAVFSLVLSLRSLERHSLVESFNPYLFVFLLACLPFLFLATGAGRETPRSRAIFFGVLVANAFFWLPPSSYATSRLYHLFRPSPLFEFRVWEEGEKRVSYETERHEDLVRFLTDQLEGDETFFDFTNSPLLYVLTDKRFPTYVIPNLIHTSESVQEGVVADLTGLHDAGRLPFVVFEQGNVFWDNADGVPNEVRSYRVAELVYRRYVPLALIGRYEVWIARSRRDPESLLDRYRERHVLERSSEPVWHHVAGEAVDAGSWTLRAGEEDPHATSLYRLEDLPPLAGSRHWHFELRVRSPAPNARKLQVFFKSDLDTFTEETSVWVELPAAAEGSFEEVLLPIRTRPSALRLTDIRFDPPEGSELTIAGAAVVLSDVFWRKVEAEDYSQAFRLSRLPYVWGTYDPLEAATRTEVQADLLERPASLGADGEVSLRFDPAVDKSAGNYLHLRLKPGTPLLERLGAGETRVTVTYGRLSESSFELSLYPGTEDEYRSYPLGRKDEPEVHHVTRFQVGERTIYRSLGDDPYVHGILDLEGLPAFEAGQDLYLVLRYRSSTDGALQVFFGYDWTWFEPESSVRAEIRRTSEHGEAALLVVPFSVTGEGVWLTDVRFDPPGAALFEVVGAEVVRQTTEAADYLIRLSTQWAWTSRPIDELRLSATGPVVIEEAVLRKGD